MTENTGNQGLPDWSQEAERLKEQYVPFFTESMGVPAKIAGDLFDTLVQEAREAAHQEGTDTFPEGFGEVLLHQEQASEQVRQAFVPKRAEGVTDEDIRQWWNFHELERRLVVRVDEIQRMLLFEGAVHKDGIEEADAAKIVAARLPIFGDSEFEGPGSAQDRPLPYELKARVNRYLVAQNSADPKAFRKRQDEASSLNALLREVIGRGEL